MITELRFGVCCGKPDFDSQWVQSIRFFLAVLHVCLLWSLFLVLGDEGGCERFEEQFAVLLISREMAHVL